MINIEPPKVGDYITIEKWLSRRDRSWCGDVLQITAINVPFFVVRNLSCTWTKKPICLCFDEVQIMPLTQDYVDALLEAEK